MENKILYQKTIKIIRDNKSNLNLNGAFVAKQLKVNRMYLHRKLKAYCNKNAGELIQTIRIKAAEELLKSDKCPLMDEDKSRAIKKVRKQQSSAVLSAAKHHSIAKAVEMKKACSLNYMDIIKNKFL